jgi:hypothetical protein
MADLQTSGNNESHAEALASNTAADAMDPFTLKEALHRATMPYEYVHRAESRRLEREEKADKTWA